MTYIVNHVKRLGKMHVYTDIWGSDMGYLAITDKCGEPIEVDTGLYFRFMEVDYPDEMSQLMRDFRLLPCDRTAHTAERLKGKQDIYICDDVNEYKAMRDVMVTCSRLAAFGFDKSDGKRKPLTSDLERIRGFKSVSGGAFLHLDLSESYWYKRFLYQTLNFDYTIGDGVFAPIRRIALVDDERIGETKPLGFEDDPIRQLMNDSGTFEYSPLANEQLLGELSERDVSIYKPSILGCITRRLAFERFERIPDLRDDKSLLYASDSEAEFWTDNELIIRACGDNLREAARKLADILLRMHTASTWHQFSFENGFSLQAPMGVCALWADYASCFSKRPITICRECGKPIVENHPPRGVARVYCSDACRKRDKRRAKREQANSDNPPG